MELLNKNIETLAQVEQLVKQYKAEYKQKPDYIVLSKNTLNIINCSKMDKLAYVRFELDDTLEDGVVILCEI